MSVHSEVGNLFKNKSGNAALSVRARSGESEAGAEYFDMRASTAPNALEVVCESEQQSARKKFLVKYFTLLKERLNRFEFEYVKQLYAEGQAESVICDNLGLDKKKFKRGLQKKLTASADDIAALVEASDWDDAELFAQCFLSAPQDIQDVNEINFLPKTVKGFGNLIERLAYRRYRKIYKAEWYMRRKFERPIVQRGRPMAEWYLRALKERVRSISAILRIFAFERLFDALSLFVKLERDELAQFETVYNIWYEGIAELVGGLYRIVVDGVPCEQVEQEEQAAREARRKEKEVQEVEEAEEA